MTGRHSAPQRGLDAPRSTLSQGRFGRMFHNLHPAQFGINVLECRPALVPFLLSEREQQRKANNFARNTLELSQVRRMQDIPVRGPARANCVTICSSCCRELLKALSSSDLVALGAFAITSISSC